MGEKERKPFQFSFPWMIPLGRAFRRQIVRLQGKMRLYYGGVGEPKSENSEWMDSDEILVLYRDAQGQSS